MYLKGCTREIKQQLKKGRTTLNTAGAHSIHENRKQNVCYTRYDLEKLNPRLNIAAFSLLHFHFRFYVEISNFSMKKTNIKQTNTYVSYQLIVSINHKIFKWCICINFMWKQSRNDCVCIKTKHILFFFFFFVEIKCSCAHVILFGSSFAVSDEFVSATIE